MQDNELINHLKNGNPEAFKKLIEIHQVPLIRLCKGFLHNEEDARDITQETFIEVFQSVRGFREDASLATWLYRIAVNKSLNLIRKNKMNRFLSGLDVFSTPGKNDTFIQHDDSREQPGFLIENRERSLQIRQAIDLLPKNQRIAFILNKYQDLTYKEIAEVMDISLSSVEALLHRAKLNLQKRLFRLYKKNLI
jgi:RNA polymerase sigma-70 factor, ECF subfamily